MKRTKNVETSDLPPMEDPGLTPEARQNQLISLSIDLAEKQLREGTASSQVITHYLKLATEREKLEARKLENEIEMIKAKTEALQSTKEVEELYKNAIEAMRRYSSTGGDNDFTNL